jgi:hypothetical protein
MRKISGGGGPGPAPSRRRGGSQTRDSMQRCPQQADIYLAIRYHGRPALQKNPVYPVVASKSMFGGDFEEELRQKFESTGIAPWMLQVQNALKALFTGVLYPFYLLFSFIPSWVAQKVFPVIVSTYKAVSEPLIKAYKTVVTPLKAFYARIVDMLGVMQKKAAHILLTIKKPILNLIAALNALVSRIVTPFSQKMHKILESIKKRVGNISMPSFLQGLLSASKPKPTPSLMASLKKRCLGPIQQLLARIADIKTHVCNAIIKPLKVVVKACSLGVKTVAIFLAWTRIFAAFTLKIAQTAYIELFQKKQ